MSKKSTTPRVTKSDAEWREELSPEAYRVTRQHGTERAFSGPHLEEHRPGTFHCVCCREPLFETRAKFESGTGWPSFYEPASGGAVAEHEDRKLFMRQTEVRCANCDAHLGHVFPDGPRPTGQRYCMNGVALTFAQESDGDTENE